MVEIIIANDLWVCSFLKVIWKWENFTVCLIVANLRNEIQIFVFFFKYLFLKIS